MEKKKYSNSCVVRKKNYELNCSLWLSASIGIAPTRRYTIPIAVLVGSDWSLHKLAIWNLLSSAVWVAFSGKISTPYSSFGMTYASYIFIAAEGLIPLEPWRPVFMRAYMVLLARLMRSSILISFSFISDLIIPRCTAWLLGQISDSPKVHFSVDFNSKTNPF